VLASCRVQLAAFDHHEGRAHLRHHRGKDLKQRRCAATTTQVKEDHCRRRLGSERQQLPLLAQDVEQVELRRRNACARTQEGLGRDVHAGHAVAPLAEYRGGVTEGAAELENRV